MSAPTKIKAAAAQYPIGQPGDFVGWQDKAARWVRTGAETGADLLVFPEYGLIELAATRGEAVGSDALASMKAVADLTADAVDTYRELAGRHRVHILAPSGPGRACASKWVNTARLITPEGRVGFQDKMIMTPFEREWGVSGGEKLRVFDTALGRLGIAICYDSEFPLLVRALVEAGADTILVPSCTEHLSGYMRVRTAAAARALENGVATVVAVTVGDALWSPIVDHNVGAAGAFVPADHGLSLTGVLAEGVLNEAYWVLAEIDFAALRRLRGEGEMRNRSDWPLQPGAVPLADKTEVVDLR
jgi:predicted amidohydrolase